MSRKFGVGPCIIAGFKHAKGDAVVYMDSDLQDPPEIIPDLILEHEKGNEIVHTVRTKREGENKIKLLITKIAYKVINYFADINLPIESGDFKLISKRALEKILDQKEYRPYVRGLSVWVGFKQSFVKYERKARGHGETKMSFIFKRTCYRIYKWNNKLFFKTTLFRNFFWFFFNINISFINILCYIL
jgi:glycosyltransferase involved in cell wall biosynthesis